MPGAVVVVVAALTGCSTGGAVAPGSTTSSSAPASTVSPPAPPTTAVASPPLSIADQPVAALVARLAVAPESDGVGYEREAFGDGWLDADDDGCDTRDEVLIAESVSPPQVDPSGCHVVAGDWVSPYDGYETPDPTELEIDHVVALAEAWRSGAATWTPERRLAYANDLDEPAALVAVTAATNASKSDRDPSSWQPPNPHDWCRFARVWATVKLRWGLTADPAEAAALASMARGC